MDMQKKTRVKLSISLLLHNVFIFSFSYIDLKRLCLVFKYYNAYIIPVYSIIISKKYKIQLFLYTFYT